MKNTLLALFASCLILGSCGDGSKTSSSSNDGPRVAKGDKVYGGTLKVAENEDIQSLYPHKILDAITWRLATQIYEGLVKFKQSAPTEVMPACAESWNVDESGTVYTFNLRKEVYFHDDPCFADGNGREVTANDFKYCFELLCSKWQDNHAFGLTFKDRVKGANAYFAGESEGGIEGIKVIDDHTLEITLENPYSPFPYILASPLTAVFPHEAYEKYKMDLKVGSGPFAHAGSVENQSTTLVRNPKYYGKDADGNQLPYIDTVEVKIIQNKSKELTEFKKGQLDLIYGLPTESIIEVLEQGTGVGTKYTVQRDPEMSIQYYEFLNQGSVFESKKVRQAFSYAIDRTRIVEYILKGESEGPGIYGVTPPTFKGYDITQIKGYEIDVDKARQLLADAGYPDGKGFPKVVLEYNRGSRNEKVALEMQKQLQNNLNINLEISVVSLAQKIERSQNGKLEFFRSGWIADFPSPENFLMLLYGKNVPETLDEPSYPNTSRYVNPEFDALFEKALSAATEEESNQFFMEAEKLAMADAPMIILWYEESYRLLQPYVQGAENNPMQFRDYSVTYFKK